MRTSLTPQSSLITQSQYSPNKIYRTNENNATNENIDNSTRISFTKLTCVVMLAVDIIMIEAAVGGGVLIRFSLAKFFSSHISLHNYYGIMAGLLLLPVLNIMWGINPGYGLNAVERIRQRVLMTAIVFITLIVWHYLFTADVWSRGVLFFTFLLALVLGPLADALAKYLLIASRLWGVPVWVVGTAETAKPVIDLLQHHYGLGYRPVGILDPGAPGPANAQHERQSELCGLPVRGMDALPAQADAAGAVAVVSMKALCQAETGELGLLARLRFRRTILIPELHGLQSTWVTGRDLGGVLALELQNNLLKPENRVIKRVLDLCIAGPAALLALPLIGTFALLIKWLSPGPIFYTQLREGHHGRPIRVLKLRTMYVDAEARLARHLEADPVARAEWARFYKLKNDPRVLPGIGHLMRRLSIDELPQLFQVIRNEMSLVGPRPFPGYHLDAFDPAFRRLRLEARPGITGLWQVEDRSNGDLGRQQMLDTYYIRNWSIWLDIYVLFRTIGAVFRPRGAH